MRLAPRWSLAILLAAALAAGCQSKGGSPGTKGGAVANTACPYDGRPVDSAYAAAYEGHRVGFDSQACLDRWHHSGSADRAQIWRDCCQW